MTKEEWLEKVCNDCPIDQVIHNCYCSSCNKDKCYDRWTNERFSFTEGFADLVDWYESMGIIKEMLKEQENGMD